MVAPPPAPKLLRQLVIATIISPLFVISSLANAQVPAEVRTKLHPSPPSKPHAAELNLGFNFRYPPDAEYLQDIKDTIQTTSELLCDATEGQLLINQVRLTEGAVEEDVADVYIFPQYGRSGVGLNHQGNLAGGPPIRLYRENDVSYTPVVLLHELGHYLFGLGEQYGEQRRWGAACGIGQGFDPGMLSETDHSIMQQPIENRCVTEDPSTGYFEITGGPCGGCPATQACDTAIHRCRETDTNGAFFGLSGNECGTCSNNETCEYRGRLRCIIPDANEPDGYRLFGNACSDDSHCTAPGAKCQIVLSSEFSVDANHDPIQGSGAMCRAAISTSTLTLKRNLDVNVTPENRDASIPTFVPLNYVIAEWTSAYASKRNRSGLSPIRGCASGLMISHILRIFSKPPRPPAG